MSLKKRSSVIRNFFAWLKIIQSKLSKTPTVFCYFYMSRLITQKGSDTVRESVAWFWPAQRRQRFPQKQDFWLQTMGFQPYNCFFQKEISCQRETAETKAFQVQDRFELDTELFHDSWLTNTFGQYNKARHKLTKAKNGVFDRNKNWFFDCNTSLRSTPPRVGGSISKLVGLRMVSTNFSGIRRMVESNVPYY